MTAPNPDSRLWRKSSYSAEENCVELAFVSDVAAVRDSKDPDGPKLAFSPAALGKFLGATKNGRLNRD
jgi:hypothetical protein